jgi:hypothetical protein
MWRGHCCARDASANRMDQSEIGTCTQNLEAEVNHGGFHQFFYNSVGDDTAEIVQALQAIGAARMADIVKRAAAKFPGGMPPKERRARQDILLEKFPETTEFDELDAEFFAYPDDLAALLTKKFAA